eukprot:UN15069
MITYAGYAMVLSALVTIASPVSFWVFLVGRVLVFPFYYTSNSVINAAIGEVTLPRTKGRIFRAIDSGDYLVSVLAFLVPSFVFSFGVSDSSPIYAPTAGHFVLLIADR